MAIMWKSEINDEMISHLSDIDADELMNQLDEAVMAICLDFGVN